MRHIFNNYFWPLLIVLLAFVFATSANAQNVGTYTEQNGAVRNVVGVTPIGAASVTPGTVADGAAINGSYDTYGNMRVRVVAHNVAGIDAVGNTAGVSLDMYGDASASTALRPLYVANMAYNGTSWDRQRGDANGLVVQPALSATYWAFAGATGGIVNTTTAVTLKAAAGASVRNYICTLNVGHDALGAATELAVRDGAAGTVIFRMKLQTAANEGASEITFAPCLKGTANTLMEVVTLTATVTGGVFVNASGYTGI